MRRHLNKITNSWLSGSVASKVVTFGTIGLGNTLIDLGVFTLAYKVIELPLVPSNVLAWLVAVSASYVMNTLITFRAESGRILRLRDYFTFVASGGLGVVATTTTLVVLSSHMPVLVAKLVSVSVGFVVNFAMSHFVVFRPKIPAGR